MTGITIKSRTNKNIVYFISDLGPDSFNGEVPQHLRDSFKFDFSNLSGDESRLRELIRDCAHPELNATLETSVASAGRFIQAFRIKTPTYFYKTELDTYSKQATENIP